MPTSTRRGRRLAAASVVALLGLPALPAAASAGQAAAAPPAAAKPRAVATGLDNPRHVRWEHGALYVAEAGVGGTGACITSAEGGRACLGRTGAITRVGRHGQVRVVRGLPSVAVKGGASAVGPSDVDVHGRWFSVALGLGADPKVRAALGAAGKHLGTVSAGRFGRSGLRTVADVAAYEQAANPDGKQRDTNAVALAGRGWHERFVVDAGGNDLLRLDRRGRLRTAAVFPAVTVPAPPGVPNLPPTLPMDAVPTAAAVGPDGALYVSQLTGFPFPVGGASVWRVVPGHAPTRWATGLTTVTSLAFGRDGALYAVQITDRGLLTGSTGSVVRVPPGGGARHTTVVAGLASPYGIAVHGGAAYVTTCSTCPDQGQLLRVPLPARTGG